MSDLRKSTGAMRLAIKAAVRRALTLAGGGESVQHATRVNGASLSRYASANPDHELNHAPIDVVLDLDLEAGQPVILAAFADAQGYDIVRRERPDTASDMPWCAKMGILSKQDSAVLGQIGDALADGKISPAEGRCIVDEIEKEELLLRRLKERVIAESGAGR
ncbi:MULTISPECIES: hypothetical protein [unclassified Aureimonas]|uniref:hypothetical protein n=1 Tax=unclassified Aureimonas TaxID=2615206 RepID=UPI000701272C|nr:MULTISPECIES: hypothetical protein [unclassified Aureimonas]KQT70578.1 hypothetical protein ASG54_21800 [Aureimonas sp. Leaf460]